MKIIACISCHALRYPKHDQGGGHHNGESRIQAVKDTWYKNWQKVSDQIDLKFFYGRWPEESTRLPEDNEVFLDCRDDYYGLPEKVKAVFKWCTENGYDHICKVDDDVFVHLDRLLANFEPVDYRGYECEGPTGKYASGTAYWISSRAAKLVAEAELDPKWWAEDATVGLILARNNISLVNDERYLCCSCEVCLKKYSQDSIISIHTTRPEQMYSFMETSNA